MKMRFLVTLAAFALVATVHSRALAAEDPEAVFAEANGLLEAGNFEAALPVFERAQKLDPGIGTMFNIALCHQKLGRLAVAYRMYEEVFRLAQVGGKKARQDAATQKLAELKPQLAYFVIDSKEPGEIVVRVDGESVNKASWKFVPVDPGVHHVEATASTKKPWSADIAAPGTGEHAEVMVPLLEVATVETTDVRRTVGYAVGGLGIVGIGAAAVTGIMVLNAKSTADEHCPGGKCQDTTGADAVSSGKTLQPINAVAWGVGVVGLGVGTYLILTSGKGESAPPPKNARMPARWLPSLTPLQSGAMLGLGGTL